MGIDPGSRVAGFGVLEISPQGDISHVSHGILNVQAESDNFYERIYHLGLQIREIMNIYKPSAVAVENIFLGKNADSAFKLGHARGVLAYEVKHRGLPLFDYSTRLVKKSVTGSGAADKEQVQNVLRLLLKLPAIKPYDASDALAVAYHHAAVEISGIKVRRMEAAR